MPTPKEKRDYDKEYERDHKSKKSKKDRAARNKARKEHGLKKGDGKEVDHKVPLSKGGSRTSKKNQRVVSRKTNRKKADK
jgi:hypothetical protein